MSAVSEPASFARDMESRIGDALDGLAALALIGRSDDWPSDEKVERLRSAIEWTVDRLKADLTAALNAATDVRA